MKKILITLLTLWIISLPVYATIEIDRFNNPNQTPSVISDDPGDGPIVLNPIWDLPEFCGLYKSILTPEAYWWYWMNLSPSYGFMWDWE